MKTIVIIAITAVIAMLTVPKQEYQVEAEFSVPKKDVGVAPSTEVGVTSPTPTPALGIEKPVMSKNELEKMICEVFGKDCADALKIAFCESGIRGDAIGDHAIAFVQDGVEYGKSYGVFQIRHLKGRPNPDQLLDPVFNINYAYEHIFRPQGGWQAWSCKYKLAQAN